MTLTSKNKIKKLAAATFLLALLVASIMNGQNSSSGYSNAFGIRAGLTSGLTYKHQFGGGNALEVIVQTAPGLTALYEKHFATNAQGLNWYAGGGAHITTRKSKQYVFVESKDRYYYYHKTYYYGTAAGLDLIAGLEYKVPSVPLAFSFDVKPMIEFYDDSRAYMYIDPSLGIKFAF